MSKRKADHHDAGIFDDDLQLFLLPGQKINKKIYLKFKEWVFGKDGKPGNLPCIEWLEKELDKRTARSHIKKSIIEALIDTYDRHYGLVKTDPDYGYNSQITTLVMRHLVWREHHFNKPHRHQFEFRHSPEAKTCSVCKRRNRPTARFCDKCGAPITGQPGEPSTPPPAGNKDPHR